MRDLTDLGLSDDDMDLLTRHHLNLGDFDYLRRTPSKAMADPKAAMSRRYLAFRILMSNLKPRDLYPEGRRLEMDIDPNVPGRYLFPLAEGQTIPEAITAWSNNLCEQLGAEQLRFHIIETDNDGFLDGVLNGLINVRWDEINWLNSDFSVVDRSVKNFNTYNVQLGFEPPA